MAFAHTARGRLYFDVVDRVVPWETARDPILFHHGIGASSGTWTEWHEALAERHKLIFFDMRGYGRSHHPEPRDGWALDQLIADIFAVADATGLDRFHLVGESIGGTI